MTQLLPRTEPELGTALEVHHTTCTLDCPDTCSLAVTVTLGADGRGRISDIDAGPGNALTDGWICAKVKKHPWSAPAQRVLGSSVKPPGTRP